MNEKTTALVTDFDGLTGKGIVKTLGGRFIHIDFRQIEGVEGEETPRQDEIDRLDRLFGLECELEMYRGKVLSCKIPALPRRS